ncbi:unnamed protein product [Ranitomeya imitator]|uniref:CDGSH iron-sulfur domain-containing protein 2 n=1 Tax=Ranitomeya imitator TaxID=111125 RepID=A0ABN9KRG5_9NEOB|nr:unnamed protein product [Ranitomeya imitator]
MLVNKWGLPEIDLFASRQNAKVEAFFSLNPRDGSRGVDALAQEWNFRLAYAFPPIPILAKVLQKGKEATSVCRRGRFLETELTITIVFTFYVFSSVSEWLRLLPFLGVLALLGYLAIRPFLPKKKQQKDSLINLKIQKENPKVVNEINIEDLHIAKAAYCRCWRSKTGKHRVTKRRAALSNPMFTLVTIVKVKKKQTLHTYLPLSVPGVLLLWSGCERRAAGKQSGDVTALLSGRCAHSQTREAERRGQTAFPVCDGSHNKHNELTGDNIGPLILKKKDV